jgi:hypothetical protein
MMMFRAAAELELAELELALDRDQGPPYTCSPANVSGLAAALQTVAVAGLGHVDALLIDRPGDLPGWRAPAAELSADPRVDPLARRPGPVVDAAHRQVALAEPAYLVAGPLSRVPADGIPHELSSTWGEDSVSASLLALAGHQVAYRSAAILIARLDSFAVHASGAGKIDATGRPAPPAQAEALRRLLANAERSARAHARAARIATGAIPLQAKLAYQRATSELAGSLDDQLDALAELWTASAASLDAVAMARN